MLMRWLWGIVMDVAMSPRLQGAFLKSSLGHFSEMAKSDLVEDRCSEVTTFIFLLD